MLFKIHGVIGGPRRKIKVKSKKAAIEPTTRYISEVIIASSEEKVIEEKTEVTPSPIIVKEPLNYNDIDPIIEEDKDFDLSDLLLLENHLTCSMCGFVSKSERGLKSHKRWRHK